MITRVGDRPYAEYVQTEILDPLGMSSTVFVPTEDQRGRFYTGYDAWVPGDPETLPLRTARYTHLNGEMACGQLHPTVHDLAKWISFQFREDGERGEQGMDQHLAVNCFDFKPRSPHFLIFQPLSPPIRASVALSCSSGISRSSVTQRRRRCGG